jgi:glutamine synthetase
MNHIIPTAIKYQNILIENVRGIKEFFPDKLQEYAGKEMETLSRIAELSNIINDTAGRVTTIRHEINRIPDIPERAGQYEARIVPIMAELRASIDELEQIVDDSLWPMTKYRELLASL